MSIRVGVVGIGTMGEHHVRNYASMDHAELMGLYDVDFVKAKKIAKTFNTVAYEDLTKLLKNIQAASICVPTPLHKQVASEIMSKKIHVLLEKPISLDVKEADEIIQCANKYGARLMIGHVERFNPAIITLNEVMDHDKIIYIESQRLGPYDGARQNTGVALDLMIHDLDVVLNMVNSDIKQITSIVSKVQSKTEDIAHAQIRFANGVIAVFTASRISQKRVRTLNITQRESYITADYHTQEVLIRSGLTSEYVGGQNVSYKQVGAVEIPYVQRGEPLKNELEHFITAVSNQEPFAITAEEARKSLMLAHEVVNRATN